MEGGGWWGLKGNLPSIFFQPPPHKILSPLSAPPSQTFITTVHPIALQRWLMASLVRPICFLFLFIDRPTIKLTYQLLQCWAFRNLMRNCATYAIAELALRLLALFLALAQLAERLKINICFLRFLALRTIEILRNLRFIALRNRW